MPATLDAYITSFPPPVRALLRELRRTIRAVAPHATERISYRIPTFDLDGRPLIYFAAFKNHVSLYPVPRQHPDFEEALASYKGGKGTAQFPLDRRLPTRLIRRIVKFRMRSHREGAEAGRSERRSRSAAKPRAGGAAKRKQH